MPGAKPNPSGHSEPTAAAACPWLPDVVPLPQSAERRREEDTSVALFRRRRAVSTGDRRSGREDIAHLEEFARTRRGVEAYVEPRTRVTETTVILIAHDGEWTRRRVPGPEGARQLANRLGIPLYDVALVGYPKRMRDYNDRRRDAEP
jgi:hypothetical protein